MMLTRPREGVITIPQSKIKALAFVVFSIVGVVIFEWLILGQPASLQEVADTVRTAVAEREVGQLIFVALPFVFVVPHLFQQIAIVLWGLTFTLDQSSQTIRKNETLVACFEDVERLHVRQHTSNGTANYDLVLILRNGRRFSLATSSNQNEIYDAAEEIADLLHITDETDRPVVTAQAQRVPRWVPYIVVAVGAAVLVGGVVTYLNTRAFVEHAHSVPGTVIDLVERHDSDGGMTYAPKVRFREPIEDREIEFVSSMSSSPPAYHRGEQVTVLYDPDNPEDAKIKGLFDLWGASIILAFIGLMFFIGGLLFIRFQRARV